MSYRASLGLLLEPVAVTLGTPASSRGGEQSTEVAGPRMAALVLGALLLPGPLWWDRSPLSCLSVQSVCVYATVASILRSWGWRSPSVAHCLAVWLFPRGGGKGAGGGKVMISCCSV